WAKMLSLLTGGVADSTPLLSAGIQRKGHRRSNHVGVGRRRVRGIIPDFDYSHAFRDGKQINIP
ncbi:MAG: hypothetical protein V3T40_02925, partial [Nitrososphaerales archaeon]